MISLCGCHELDNHQMSDKPLTNQNKQKEVEKNQEFQTNNSWYLFKGKNPNFTIQKKQYCYKKIDIKYPALTGKQKTKVNKLVKQTIFKKIENSFGTNYKDLKNFELSIDYKIKFQNNRFISICFLGYSDVKGTVHPNDLLYTLNIDLQKVKLCKLADFYNINGEFLDALDNNFKNQYSEDYWEALDMMYSGKDLEKQLKKADMIKKYVLCRSYFTKKKVVIIFEVPHGIGSQILVKINQGELPKKE